MTRAPRPRANNPLVVTAAGAVMLLTANACAVPIPRAGGAPLAPPAPNDLWRPPRGAEVADSLRAGGPPPGGLAARAASLTLSDVVDLALRNNPATRSSWAQARAAADAYGAARGAYFPTLSGSLDALRSRQTTGGIAFTAGGSTQPAGGSGAGIARTELIPSLSLSYLVFDFGGRGGTAEGARETAYAVSFTHNAVVQSTVLQVERAYYTYVAARALLDAQRTSVREAQASYDAARGRDSVGLATIADVLQAQTALGQAQLALIQVQAQVETARSGLALALGVSPTVSYDIAASPDTVPVGDLTASVESLIDEALRTRPDLQAAYATVGAARAAVRVAHAASLPSLQLSGTTSYAEASPGTLSGRSYSVSLGLQIPVFDGFSRSYDLARARALADNASAQADAVRQTVIADVFTAYYDLQTATQQVRTSDELLVSATASLRAAQARYRAGVGSILDLLAAQAALATARAQHSLARWGWAQQLAVLAHAAGALDVRGATTIPVVRDSTRRALIP